MSGPIVRPIMSTNAILSSDDTPREVNYLLGLGHSGSPMSRAGLLQPRSYVSSKSPRPRNISSLHSQDTIRDNTMQLSSFSLQTPSVSQSQDAFIFPAVDTDEFPDTTSIMPASVSVASLLSTDSTAHDLTASIATMTTIQSGTTTPRGHSESFRPSGLSILLAREGSGNVSGPGAPFELADNSGTVTPTVERLRASVFAGRLSPDVSRDQHGGPSRASDVEIEPSVHSNSNSDTSELAPLLTDLEAARPPYTTNGNPHSGGEPVSARYTKGVWHKVQQHRNFWHECVNVGPVLVTAVNSIPAVLLGTLLNILDGISYGMIIFPATGVFANLGGSGVSMFFVSAILAQLVYSFGGSGFAGANGSMMIEVVPFFHILATSIAQQIDDDQPRAILATTMVAFALSSVLTGLSFFLLGALKLGNLIGFFPRHILVGCIGGVGVFLIITGLTVCSRMAEDDFSFSLYTLKYLFLNIHNLVLWAPAFGLAVLLRLITLKYHHQLLFPVYFVIIPIIFYIVVAIGHLDLNVLRREGWLFDLGTTHEPWYIFYSYYDFGAISWTTIWSTLPTQFAMLFFNILHPPLNVPALAVSLNHDVDTNKELVAHGYSNLLSGILGTVPNYLVYVNTLLFYRVGGTTRISGFLLAGATTILLFIGTGPIAYIPVMMVGALIFVLGIDLVKEAIWDTRHRASSSEYVTIASIMVCMTVWDFVTGVIFGLVVSCLFFVIQNSRRRSIRALHTGEAVMSTVRRPGAHRAYLREVSRLTTVIRLQGFLFFGTIAHVEETIRELVEGAAWQHNPMRFLILDLSLAAGVDMSAAEAFVRVQRFLAAKTVVLVLCGFESGSSIGQSLSSVNLLDMDGVELFSTFNDALEWTENAYLRAWFFSQKVETSAVALPGRQDAMIDPHESLSPTPRRSHVLDAGWRTMGANHSPDALDRNEPEPFSTLVKAFSTYDPTDRERLRPLIPYLERVSVPEGAVLWEQGDNPDGFYIVESGVLRAVYRFAEHVSPTEESMVPGTLAGELSALTGLSRNATCVVERPAVLWKLSSDQMRRLETEQPELAMMFTKLVLKAAKLDYDTLISALASRQ